MTIIPSFISMRQTSKQFLKYGVVGASGFLLHISLVYMLTEWLGLWYMQSTVMAACVAWMSNFTFNKLWTFRGR
jgi:dolichol-phosphate mannosyltransferase